MRILLVFYWNLPHTGGVNTYINTLKSILEKHNHQVDILAQHPDLTKVYLLNTDKQVYKKEIIEVVHKQVIDYFQKVLPEADDWIRWREIEKITFELAAVSFDLDQYDLIHTQDIISSRALRRVKPGHVPLVNTIHSFYSQERIQNKDISDKESLRWRYVVNQEYVGITSSDITIVPTQWMKQEVGSFGVPRNKVTVLPYGMDIYSFLKQMVQEPDPPLQNDFKHIVLICPARLAPEKGHFILIDSLSKLKEIRSDFICWLTGDGPLKNDIERYAKQKNVADEILFMGTRDDVPALLEKADIVILPSIQENHPFVIMEAQVAGKAVVASAVGGIPEMIEHGKTGLLFEKGNSMELMDRLLKVMNDLQFRRQLEIRARAWGETHWSGETLYRRTMNIYDLARDVPNSPSLGASAIDQNEKFDCTVIGDEDHTLWTSILANLPLGYSVPDKDLLKMVIK